jgi:hypothetical protein
MHGYGEFMAWAMAATFKFFVWAFTRGWPVGIGLLVAAVMIESGAPDWLTWLVFCLTVGGGYAYKFRDRLRLPKKGM